MIRKIHRFAYIVVGLAAILLVVAFIIYLGERDIRISSPVHSDSVANLVKSLPNFRELDVDAVDFTISRTREVHWIPSPSDSRIELLGCVKLTAESASQLEKRFSWRAILIDKMPAQLLSILPPGDYLSSAELDGSFEGNPFFAHGRVVVLVGQWKCLYFVASDLDHPIE